MSNPRNSCKLYDSLCNMALNMFEGKTIPSAHNSLFKTTKESLYYYKSLYLDQIEPHQLGRPTKSRPDNETCKYCSKFNLSNLKNIDKNSDIQLGNNLENCFQGFMSNELKGYSSNLVIERADQTNLHMSDFKVIDKVIGKDIFFFEFKVIFRPFLKISERVNPNFYCYSHSLTLDVSNGKKLGLQRELVEEIGVSKVVYVYWYDLPCVKGIFWLSASEVYKLQDEQVTYKRNVVEGDLNKDGKLRAAINKIYLPLHKMNDFYSLFQVIMSS